MSLENNFLDIYEVVLDEGFEEFYSSDLDDYMDLKPGSIGNILYRTIDKYDIPLSIEREAPADPSLFVVEERLSYDELERILDPDPSDLVVDEEQAAMKDTLEKLENRQYTDPELLVILGEAVEKYYDRMTKKHEIIGQIKQELIDEEVIVGSMRNGWSVKGDLESRK